MPRLRLIPLVLALALAGCDSQIHSAATPAAAPLGVEAGIPAILSAGAGGSLVTIQNPTLLPEAVRQASDLKAAIGTVQVPVTRAPGGHYSFTVPANARLSQDVAGNIRVVFVMDEAKSQIVTLKTGSPVAFANPPVITEPNPAFVTRGIEVKLRANTEAAVEQYQFTWSAGPSAQGPWQAIPGEGKEARWTPAVAGNYYIKVDAIDRATQQSYATVTPAAVVFVTEGADVVTTDPAGGSIQRGSEVGLTFNRPAGLVGENLGYAWSAGPSPQGPWSSISGSGTSVRYLPTTVGGHYVRVEVTNRDTGTVSTFITPQAEVTVTESQPIIQPSAQTVQRGDKVDLTLNIASAGEGPFTWYYSRTGAMGPWSLLTGTAKVIPFVAADAGSYSFRVDIPQAGGGVKSFTSTEPVLNATESVGIVVSDPLNQAIEPGGSVTLVLNARGVTENDYRFLFSVAQTPQGPWSQVPTDSVDDLYKKRRRLDTAAGSPAKQGELYLPDGAYYVRVEASERNGTQSYTFVSTSPAFTVQR